MDKDYARDIVDAARELVSADKEVAVAQDWRYTRLQALKDLLK